METLRDLDLKCDQAKIDAMENGDEEAPWVETTDAIYRLIQRKRQDKAEYQDYHGVKICRHGEGERLRKELDRQLGEIIHGDSKVNQITATRPNVGSVK